jgi:hypothetical protein
MIFDNECCGFDTLSFDADGNCARACGVFTVLVLITDGLVALTPVTFGLLRQQPGP